MTTNHEAGEEIILFGAGRMGSALLRSWIKGGFSPDRINVRDPRPTAELIAFAEQNGVRLNSPPCASERHAIVVAVKPQMIASVEQEIKAIQSKDKLIISVLAGSTLADLATLFPEADGLVRTMPNLPIEVGRGLTTAVARIGTSAPHRRMVTELFSAGGTLLWLEDEALINAATAIAGSGPAYIFYIAECMTRAGAALGLAPDLAARLARATISGAGEMLHQSSDSPEDLRHAVTSPGGTTQQGLSALMHGKKLEAAFSVAARRACRRAAELSKSMN